MWPTLLLTSVAQARPPGWFRDGAAAVELPPVGVALPLLRGPTTSYLPAIEVLVPVAGQDRSVLAVLDVAGGWSRMSSETARAIGVTWEYERVGGEWHQSVVLPEVRAGGLRIEELRVEIDDDAPGFVLGVRALDELAVAIVASEALVRFTGEALASTLLKQVGEPIEAGRRSADGLTLQVPGALRDGAETA